MKTMKIFYALLTGALLMVLAACGKDEGEFLHKGDMLPVVIKGYNGSSEELVVKIDTFKFKFDLPSQQALNQSDAYTFIGDRTTALLTITEKTSGKLVLERQLEKGEKNVAINLFYTNEGLVDYNPPPVNPNVNIVGVFITKNVQTIINADIAVTLSGNVVKYLAKDVPPNQWFFFETDYIPTVPATERIAFRRAGTTLGYYQDATGRNIFSNFPLFPVDGTKGELRSYIITGSTGVRNIAAARVF